MKLNKKLEIVEQAIESIASHVDVDAAIREAALDQIVEIVAAKKEALAAEVKIGIEAALGSGE